MASSDVESSLDVRATDVVVTEDTITVCLADGRSVSVPTAWYPRLKHATPKERANFEISASGIEWPDIEADFSIRGLLLGHRSGECTASFRYWLENRKRGRRVTFIDYMEHVRKQKKKARKRSAA